MMFSKKKGKTDKLVFFKGAYEAVELIGEGSFGKVYKVKKEDFNIESFCAVKTISIPQTEYELTALKKEGMDKEKQEKYFESIVKKWVDEIQLMSLFKDSINIVNIEDYEIIKDPKEVKWTINIRMELLKSIDDIADNEKITDKSILKMAIDICNALKDCEENNVIHRDIKPENIFVNNKGVYKLGDFGVAKKTNETLSNLSKRGTENYMAPELYISGKGDKTVDIYSLGIMLYRFFNYNRLPFLPDYPNEITSDDRENAILKRNNGEKLKPPLNASKKISDIILKMCDYYPAERYRNIDELINDLNDAFAEIKKPKVLFDYDSKKMEKIYSNNTKNDTHSKTLSAYSTTQKYDISETSTVAEKEEKEINNKVEEKEPEIEIKEEKKTKVKKENKKDKSKKVKREKESIGIIKSEKSIKIKKYLKLFIPVLIIILILILLISTCNKKEEIVIMPNVLNYTSEKATKTLSNLGLSVDYEYEEVTDEKRVGKVLSQDNKEGEKLKKSSIVKIKVGVSQEKVKVKDVVGKTEEEAKKIIEELGLTIKVNTKNDDNVESGKVISQMPTNGEKVSKGTIVEILVSQGKEEKNTEEETKKQESKKWSGWVVSLPSGINNSNYYIETKNQYRTQSKQTTTSTEANLTGWNKTGETKGNPIYSNIRGADSTIEPYQDTSKYVILEATRQDGYRLSYMHCDKEANGKYEHVIANSNGTCPEGYKLDRMTIQSTDNSDRRYLECYRDHTLVESRKWTEYIFYTIKYKEILGYETIYSYEKWSDWSGWTDGNMQSNTNTNVENRTLYRYKKK